jgi:hypothetical protein
MDVVSHALWGYALLRWRGPRSARWGALSGAAPDLLFGGASFLHNLATHGWHGLASTFGRNPAMWRRGGPDLPPEMLYAYDHYYVFTHSLVILATVAVAWSMVRRRVSWLFLPWAVHILMDIPLHERYLTQFLFPLSSWCIAGYAWNRPLPLLINWTALLLTYGWLLLHYGWQARNVPGRSWPEDISGVARSGEP